MIEQSIRIIFDSINDSIFKTLISIRSAWLGSRWDSALLLGALSLPSYYVFSVLSSFFFFLFHMVSKCAKLNMRREGMD